MGNPYASNKTHFTAQKMKFSIKDFFSKCDQIRRNLLSWGFSALKVGFLFAFFLRFYLAHADQVLNSFMHLIVQFTSNGTAVNGPIDF